MVTGLGREAPTVIITNDDDTKTKALIEHYARRMTIEERLAEIIRAFYADALSCTVNLNVDLDIMLSVPPRPWCPRCATGSPATPPSPPTCSNAASSTPAGDHHQRRRDHRPAQPPHLLTRPAPGRPPPATRSPGGTPAPCATNSPTLRRINCVEIRAKESEEQRALYVAFRFSRPRCSPPPRRSGTPPRSSGCCWPKRSAAGSDAGRRIHRKTAGLPAGKTRGTGRRSGRQPGDRLGVGGLPDSGHRDVTAGQRPGGIGRQVAVRQPAA